MSERVNESNQNTDNNKLVGIDHNSKIITAGRGLVDMWTNAGLKVNGEKDEIKK